MKEVYGISSPFLQTSFHGNIRDGCREMPAVFLSEEISRKTVFSR